MPDWLAPFHLPELTNDLFEEQRRKYIEKHGYTITFPGLSDIIKIPLIQPMTPQENTSWKNKDWTDFAPGRLADLKRMKQRKKERYIAMLASPSPRVARSAAAVLTALDDAQDALATIAVLGKMALVVAPRLLGRFFAGPISWLFTTAEIMQLPQTLFCNLLFPKDGKHIGDALSESNPYGKTGKLKKSRWLRRVTPTKGDWIQGLQTSNEIAGFGISLGPIVGLVQDIIFGKALHLLGKKVTVETPLHKLTRQLQAAWRATETGKSWAEFDKKPDYSSMRLLYLAAQKGATAASVLWTVPYEHTHDQLMAIATSAYLSAQALLGFNQKYSPIQDIPNPDDIGVHAPVPADPLTIEVIEEAGVPYEDVASWPQTGTRYASLIDLLEQGEPMINANRAKFSNDHKHDWQGFVANQLTIGSAFNTIAGLEGEDQMEYDFSAPMKALLIFLENGYAPDLNQPPEKIQMLVDYLHYLDRTSLAPSLKLLLSFCRHNHIKLVRPAQ